MSEKPFSGTLPILALRGLAVFPDQTVHFDVGRAKSIQALDEAMKGDQYIFLVPQKSILVDDPKVTELYPIGVVAQVKQVLKTQGENLRVLVTGICRGKILEVTQENPFLSGIIEEVPELQAPDDLRSKALRREANLLYGLYLETVEQNAQAIQLRLLASENTGFIADTIAQNSGIDFGNKAKLLCQLNAFRRLENVVKMLRQEVEMVRLEADIQEKTKYNIDQNQKDYFLREQMKVIREELGEGDDADEADAYRAAIQKLYFPEEQEKKLLKDVDRLKKQPFGSSEGAVLRNYLDTVLELPWNVKTK